MAEQTITLAVADLFRDTATQKQWRVSVQLDAVFEPLTTDRYFRRLTVRNDQGPVGNRYQMQFDETGVAPGTETASDLVDEWETADVAMTLAQGGNTLDIPGPNHADNEAPDDTDNYVWDPSAAHGTVAENFFFTLLDTSADLTITFKTPSTTPPPATVPDQPAPPALVVNSDTRITATGVAPGDGGSPITSYDWRHRITGSGGLGWVNRSNVMALIQAFPGLDAATEYDFQFRATNNVGDSPYSDIVQATTDASAGYPACYRHPPAPHRSGRDSLGHQRDDVRELRRPDAIRGRGDVEARLTPTQPFRAYGGPVHRSLDAAEPRWRVQDVRP